MNYANLVFAKHPHNNKPYLFKLPLNVSVDCGQVLIVDTELGERHVVSTCQSFILPAGIARQIDIGVGGYWPCAPVKALVSVETETVKKTVIKEL